MNSYRLSNLSYKDIIEDLDLELKLGTLNIILGKSGVGKTTLMKLLVNEFKNDGKVISYAFQDNQLISWLTVKDNLFFIMREKDEDLVLEVLKALKIEHLINRYPIKLSGGEKQRVNLARCFLNNSDIIILDEPFSSLDYENKMIIIDFIKQYTVGKTVLIVTHDLDIVLTFESHINILFKRDKVYVKSIDNLDRRLTMTSLLNAIVIEGE